METVRSERVVTFLTRDENKQLIKIAMAEGKSVSSTCHDLLMYGLKSYLEREKL